VAAIRKVVVPLAAAHRDEHAKPTSYPPDAGIGSKELLLSPGLVVSRDHDMVVATTTEREGGPRGVAVGSLLRLWTIASNEVEDHSLGPTGFFSVVPWPDDRFAIIRQETNAGPLAPEADALLAQGRLPRVSIRDIRDPLTEIAGAKITSDGRQELEGDPSAWDVPTSLLPLGFPLVLRIDRGDATICRIGVIPPSPDRGDGDDYRLTPLGDGRTLLVSHTRYGDELLIIDVVEDAVIARTALGGVSPGAVEFLPRRNEVWIGQHDQLLRFDPVGVNVSDAVRLRNDESGSFIEALRCDPSEERCAVSYALRSPQGPIAEPSGGRVLVFDVESFEVAGVADAPDWVADVALISDHRVCGQLWKDHTMWLGHISAGLHPLYPPRAPGEWNWL
jgi:hypothetical protein